MTHYVEANEELAAAAEAFMKTRWPDTLTHNQKELLGKFNHLRRNHPTIESLVDRVDDSLQIPLREFLKRSGKL